MKVSKWNAIKAIIFASNWYVITDNAGIGDVSPLYADKFTAKNNEVNERLRLLSWQHGRSMTQLADQELGEEL
jgi:hypothetical protein